MPRVSRFSRVPVNVVSGSNETRSRALSVSRLVNWYPESVPAGTSPATLMPWPGLTVVANATEGDSFVDRGSYVFNGKSYFIKGDYLYRLEPDYSEVLIGAIYGINICGFSDNGSVMLIVTGGPVYQYDGVSLSIVSGIGFNPSAITYLNGKFILNSDTDRFWHTNPGTIVIDGSNYAIPESSPDPFILPYVFNQILYLFGTESIEPWQDIGSGNPSFDRMNGAIIEEIGCSSVTGVASTNNFMYFIHRNGSAYRVRSFQADPISSSAQSVHFQTYDCSRYTAKYVSFDSQDFIIFNFYADNKTWVFSETVGEWFELSSGRDSDKWIGGSYVYCYNQHLFSDSTLRWIYRLDFESFLNNGTAIVREKTFDPVSGEKLGTVRGFYEMSKMYFGMEAGSGLLQGQGEIPLIGVQSSVDGKTWGQEVFIEIGRSGEFSRQIEWSNMQQFQQLFVRVRLYDPVGFSFFSAAIDIREAGY